MLALCIWPAVGVGLGAQGQGVFVVMSLGFIVARGCFRFGSHRALTPWIIEFAASVYPTVTVVLWVAGTQVFRVLLG
ncbi:MAG: hypothetical protein HON80_11780 [Marinovum sp.]|nr:hypothetical protein [Marinovum sp.]MBT6526261.1 hypothetical protein [Marinovum sp.]MBT6927807.1 hypothetical protein [Marinovum sp.]